MLRSQSDLYDKYEINLIPYKISYLYYKILGLFRRLQLLVCLAWIQAALATKLTRKYIRIKQLPDLKFQLNLADKTYSEKENFEGNKKLYLTHQHSSYQSVFLRLRPTTVSRSLNILLKSLTSRSANRTRRYFNYQLPLIEYNWHLIIKNYVKTYLARRILGLPPMKITILKNS